MSVKLNFVTLIQMHSILLYLLCDILNSTTLLRRFFRSPPLISLACLFYNIITAFHVRHYSAIS